MLELGVEGYFLSPEEVDDLELACERDAWNEPTRWRLLGFYYAHQLCCPKYRNRRVSHIVKMIEKHVTLDSGCRNFFSMSEADGIANVAAVKNAWQSRLDKEPENLACLENIGYFLLSVQPTNAITYFQTAHQLMPQNESQKKKSLDGWIETAEKLAAKPAQQPVHAHRTCFFEVISQTDKLLAELKQSAGAQTEKEWDVFKNLVGMLVKNATILVFIQYRNDVPQDGAADVLLRHALVDMHRLISAKTPEGKILQSEPYRSYWTELTKTK